jgi:hypothetical protein
MRQVVLIVPLICLLFCHGCSGVGKTSDAPQVQDPSGVPAALSFTWDAPVSNIDGSPLTDMAGYRIHYGTSPGVYTGSVDLPADKTQYAISDFLAAAAPVRGTTYYLAVTAFDIDNNESAYSNEITKTFE